MIRIGTGRSPAQPLQHQEAAAFGHHHVQDDQVRVLAFGQGQALIPIARDNDLVPLGFQGVPHRLDDFRIVVHQQNPFRFLPLLRLLCFPW